jgi:hypothetical protein
MPRTEARIAAACCALTQRDDTAPTARVVDLAARADHIVAIAPVRVAVIAMAPPDAPRGTAPPRSSGPPRSAARAEQRTALLL